MTVTSSDNFSLPPTATASGATADGLLNALNSAKSANLPLTSQVFAAASPKTATSASNFDEILQKRKEQEARLAKGKCKVVIKVCFQMIKFIQICFFKTFFELFKDTVTVAETNHANLNNSRNLLEKVSHQPNSPPPHITANITYYR